MTTMNISSTSSAAAYDPAQMQAQMQAKLDKLKQIDPNLESKMEQIGSKMDELRKSGTDPAAAKQAIDSQFGQFSDTEKAELKQAGFGVGHHGHHHGGGAPASAAQSPVTNSAVSALLQGQSSKGGEADSTSSLQQLSALVSQKYSAAAAGQEPTGGMSSFVA